MSGKNDKNIIRRSFLKRTGTAAALMAAVQYLDFTALSPAEAALSNAGITRRGL